MIRQGVILFMLEMTRDTITRQAELALLGEFAVGPGLMKSIDGYLPRPGSGAGYKASEYVFPLLLSLNGRGRRLKNTREIRGDEGLRAVLAVEMSISLL